MKDFQKKSKGASKVMKGLWGTGKGAAQKMSKYNKEKKLVYIPKL